MDMGGKKGEGAPPDMGGRVGGVRVRSGLRPRRLGLGHGTQQVGGFRAISQRALSTPCQVNFCRCLFCLSLVFGWVGLSVCLPVPAESLVPDERFRKAGVPRPPPQPR